MRKLPCLPLLSALFQPQKMAFAGLSLALLALASGPVEAKTMSDSHMPQFAYVGTYSPNGAGVYLLQVDKTSGALQPKGLVSQVKNPAQMVVDAQRQVLYVASEVAEVNGTAQAGGHGQLYAYRISAADGSLTLLNQVDSQGGGPVYLSLSPKGDHLLVANYISGTVAVFPLDSSGRLADASAVQQSSGPAGAAKPVAAAPGSFAASDHDGPHAHMIATDPSGNYAFSTDLGLDRIYQWRFDAQNGKLVANDPAWIPASSAGAGPRHFVFHPNGKLLFLVNEEASTLTSYRINAHNGTLSELHSASTLPPNYQGTNFAAGLVLSHNGHFLYVANRLHNSIMQFAVNEQGELKQVEETWTRGDYPRTLTLDPQGHYLYAINQRSDNITRFKLDAKSGKLSFVPGYTAVGSPSQMVFIPQKQ